MASFSLLSISPNIPNFLVPPNFPRNIPNFLRLQDILRGVHDPTQRDPGQRGVQIFGGGHGEQLRGELQEPGVPHQQLAANVFQPGSIVLCSFWFLNKTKFLKNLSLSRYRSPAPVVVTTRAQLSQSRASISSRTTA